MGSMLTIPDALDFPAAYDSAFLRKLLADAIDHASPPSEAIIGAGEAKLLREALLELERREKKLRDDLIATERHLRDVESPDVSKMAHEYGMSFDAARRVLKRDRGGDTHHLLAILARAVERTNDQLAHALLEATKPRRSGGWLRTAAAVVLPMILEEIPDTPERATVREKLATLIGLLNSEGGTDAGG